MESLPVELLQLINDQLDYVEQVAFKSSTKWLYKYIQLKPIPNIMIREHIKNGIFKPQYFIGLNKFASFVEKNIKPLLEHGNYVRNYDIYILVPNKYVNSTDIHAIGDSDYELMVSCGNVNRLYNDDYAAYNYNDFISHCFEIANKKLASPDVF